jgi:hypothetical protein
LRERDGWQKAGSYNSNITSKRIIEMYRTGYTCTVLLFPDVAIFEDTVAGRNPQDNVGKILA